MCQRLGHGHLRQLREGTPPERATGSGEDEFGHRCRVLPDQALRQRRVLRIDRHQLAAALVARRQHDVSSGDQTLFVGQGQPIPGSQGGHRRGQAGDADDPVHHHHPGGTCRFLQGIATDGHPISEAGREPSTLIAGWRGDHHCGPRPAFGQLDELIAAAPGGDGLDADPEAAGHIERLGADGTGGTEDDEPAQPRYPRAR